MTDKFTWVSRKTMDDIHSEKPLQVYPRRAALLKEGDRILMSHEGIMRIAEVDRADYIDDAPVGEVVEIWYMDGCMVTMTADAWIPTLAK